MSTATRPSPCRRSSSTRFIVSTRIVSRAVRPLSRTKRTKQRAPLPQCSTSSPVLLKMRYLKVDARPWRWLDQQDLVGADAEAAVAQAAQLLIGQFDRRARRVEHHEVIARAMHLGEAQSHAALWRPVHCALLRYSGWLSAVAGS